MTLSDELSKLAELRQSGTLTEDEFVRAKERLLNAQGPASGPPPTPAVNTFRRSRNDRWIAGVCGGIAQVTGVPSWVWRLLFTFGIVFAGSGLALYLLLWPFALAAKRLRAGWIVSAHAALGRWFMVLLRPSRTSSTCSTVWAMASTMNA